MSRGRGAAPAAPADPVPGYREVRSPSASWLARPECAADLEEGRADFLLAGPGARRARPAGGRADLARLRLGGHAVLAKRALRGGLLGRLLGGLYLGSGRARGQIALALRLDRADLPTPEILAVGWRPVLGPFHALTILAREIPQAQNLYEAAMEGSPWRRRRAILERSADLVRAMHDAGFLHADLNVSNLVIGAGPDGDRIYVVDLDKGRFVPEVGPDARFASLARLLRSYEKWVGGRGRLSLREELAFLRRYCRGDRAGFSRLRERLERYRARLRLWRLLWKLPAA